MPYDCATSEAIFYINLRPIAQLGVLLFFALCVLREKKGQWPWLVINLKIKEHKKTKPFFLFHKIASKLFIPCLWLCRWPRHIL
jgi:hypothetical protein